MRFVNKNLRQVKEREEREERRRESNLLRDVEQKELQHKQQEGLDQQLALQQQQQSQLDQTRDELDQQLQEFLQQQEQQSLLHLQQEQLHEQNQLCLQEQQHELRLQQQDLQRQKEQHQLQVELQVELQQLQQEQWDQRELLQQQERLVNASQLHDSHDQRVQLPSQHAASNLPAAAAQLNTQAFLRSLQPVPLGSQQMLTPPLQQQQNTMQYGPSRTYPNGPRTGTQQPNGSMRSACVSAAHTAGGPSRFGETILLYSSMKPHWHLNSVDMYCVILERNV